MMPKGFDLKCGAGKTARVWLQGKGGGLTPGQALVLLPPRANEDRNSPAAYPSPLRAALIDRNVGHVQARRQTRQFRREALRRWLQEGKPEQANHRCEGAIMVAFAEVGGKDYLRTVAKSDPRTFCTLLGKILPTQVTGDAEAGSVRMNSHGCRRSPAGHNPLSAVIGAGGSCESKRPGNAA
jgi:hypothetical protein